MIGVMGGTFDPVHFGHLRVALEVRELLDLDELRLVPCREPPHRPRPVAAPEIRLLMLEKAVAGEPGLVIDKRELERPGPSYMFDTLLSMRREFESQPLGLILGMDAFNGLPGWHQWRELPGLAHFIVLHRPGYHPSIPESLSRLEGIHCVERAAELGSRETGCVLFLEVSQLEISATAIRNMIRRNKSPRFLLPEPVLGLIRERGLYR